MGSHKHSKPTGKIYSSGCVLSEIKVFFEQEMEGIIAKGVDMASLPAQWAVGKVKDPIMQGVLSDKIRQARQAGKTMLPDIARSMVDAVAKRPASPSEVINKQH